MTDSFEGPDGRWQAVAALAADEEDGRLGFRRRRTFIWLAVLILVTWLVGIVFAIVGIHVTARTGSKDSVTDAQLLGQVVFLGLAFIVGITGFIWAKRTGHYITRWRAIPSPLTSAEKKQVRRQIAGKSPVDESHLPLIIAIARQGQKSALGLAPIYSALVFIMIAEAIGASTLLFRLFAFVILALWVGIAVGLVVAYRRAGRFLESHRR